MSITIYGASDDLIEIEGDIREEFTAFVDANYLAFSDGTVLHITYDHDGMWRIRPLMGNGGHVRLVLGSDPDDDYSDRATVEGDITWVMHASTWVRR